MNIRRWIFFIVPVFIILAAAGVLAYRFAAAEHNQQGWVIHTYQVMDVTNRVLADLVNAESNERAFLLTGTVPYRTQYAAAATAAREDLARLRLMVADNPPQQARIDGLRTSAERRLALLARNIALYDSSGFDAQARTLVNEGAAAMEEVHIATAGIIAHENILLTERTGATRVLERRTLLTALLGAGLALLILLAAAGLLVAANVLLRRSEAKRARQASLLQATLDNIHEGIAAFDADDTLIAFNAAFFTLLQFPERLVAQGTPLRQFQTAMPRHAEAIFGAGGEKHDSASRNLTMGNRELEIYRNAMQPGGFLVVCTDVSRRARVEAMVRQLQKMEAVGQLTGGIAHDFNNLLQIISANIEFLETALGDNPKALERLNAAISGVEKGSRLTRQLLAFARRQPLEPRVLNLGRVVQDMTNLLRRTLGEYIAIEAVVSGGLWNTLADPVQVENAILNLAINARDAMPEGGKLTIELSNAFLDDSYAAENAEVTPGQYVLLAVSDTGTGMTPEIMARVFEPFFTTKEEGEGTGLGLSQVYGFVKQSGGHIKFYSEIGHGTTAKVYLPRTKNAEDQWPGPPAGAAEGGHETVLVVEDDADVRAAVVTMLGELGYRALSADNPESGLALLRGGAKVDLLFTDVIMPGMMNTRDFARIAQDLQPDMRVLFTSGYTENAIVHNGKLDEGVALLSKPYRKQELARKLRSVLDAPRAAAERTPSPALQGGSSAPAKLRVLVVDDEFLVRMTVVDMLDELGHESVEAADGAAALEALEKDLKIDLLLTDLKLPGMDGHALIREALRRRPELVVIVASGYSAPFAAQDEGNRRIRFLAKPYMLEQLKEALDTEVR